MYHAQDHVKNTFNTLLSLVPHSERTKPQIILLAGEQTPYRNDTDRELSFRQESNFFYLSGCNVPSSLLIATHNPSSPSQLHLFIPKAEPADIMWSIPPPSLDIASQSHNASTINYTISLAETLKSLIDANPGALFHTLPRKSPLFPSVNKEYTDLILANQDCAITDAYLLPALQRTRLIKDENEVELIRKANAISSRAHETVMRVLGLAVKSKIARDQGAGIDRPLLPGEWLIEKEAEAEAIFVASCRREGAVHQAYLPIVASSSAASTLHYCCNDKEFAWGPLTNPSGDNHSFTITDPHTHSIHPQVLLIDAGCEFSNYASDITRTMPLGNNGHFTPDAKNIYNLVLEMQHAAFDMIKPGIHWDLVQLKCHQVLVRGFRKLGIFNDDDTEEVVLNSGVSSAFFPHGLGHSLGMDVHDVPEASKPVKNPTIPTSDVGHESFYAYLRLRLPLETGMVVTVEPGIYFSPHLLAPVRASKHINHQVLKRYESVGGVRIEDVIVIRDTEVGYENLTTVKSQTSWVEGVCSGEL